MHYVYVLQSKKYKSLKIFYYGYTSNLLQRFKEHNLGKVESTKENRPWVLVYYEAYRSLEDAIEREKKLKHYGNARTLLKKRIRRSLL